MPIWFVAILDIAVFWFFFGSNVQAWLRSKKAARRFELKSRLKQFKSLLERDKDILGTEQALALSNLILHVSRELSSNEPGAVEACLAYLDDKKTQASLPREKSCPKLRYYVEVIVVAVGLAFGIRALFIQPFKIPTGSMQPTLYGVHFEQREDELPSGMLARFFSYLNYSRRNVDVAAKEDGYLSTEVSPAKSYPLFPNTRIRVGQTDFIVPGDPQRAIRMLQEECLEERRNLYFEKGDVLLHGSLSLGDHLFVNRMSLCFREPRRGDVMVFMTDGLSMPDGRSFGGRFYIKRLVGLPGDELLIRDHKLHVKEPGSTEFRLLDSSDAPGFERVHSCKGYYRGYANMPGSLYLKNGNDSFKVPEGQYFMLGDNSENSLDSRYWGCVPRANLVGTACFVWWPFSRRWGLVDRVEPLPIDTQPHF